MNSQETNDKKAENANQCESYAMTILTACNTSSLRDIPLSLIPKQVSEELMVVVFDPPCDLKWRILKKGLKGFVHGFRSLKCDCGKNHDGNSLLCLEQLYV